MTIREGRSDRIFSIANVVAVTLLGMIVLYPLIYILSASVSAPEAVGSGQVILLPKGFTLDGYQRVFREKNVLIGYRNTIFITIVGTLINLVMTLPCAYALSKRELPGNGFVMGLMVFTMYFSGGMVPTFILVKNIGLYNSMAVLVVLGAVSVYNLIICRTFFAGIPKEMEEAAYIDGCSMFHTFVKIVLPLSKALMGVMVLYYGIAHWNSYFNALIYILDDTKKPLQLFLRRILIVEAHNHSMNAMGSGDSMQDAEYLRQLVKYSIIVVASLPVLIIYPFLQKYFEKGVLIGSVKG